MNVIHYTIVTIMDSKTVSQADMLGIAIQKQKIGFG